MSFIDDFLGQKSFEKIEQEIKRLEDDQIASNLHRIILPQKDGWNNAINPKAFDDIIGYEDVKEYCFLALEAGGSLSVWLNGAPASAKTLFLNALEEHFNAFRLSGANITSTGLADFIVENDPNILLIDEIEKVKRPSKDLAPLLSWIEEQRVIITTHTRQIDHTHNNSKLMVFASSNRTDKIPPEVLSRFDIFNFKEYSKNDFALIVTRILQRHEQMNLRVGYFIAIQLIEIDSYNVRDAIRLSRLVKHRKDEKEQMQLIERLIQTKKKYRSTV